MSTAQDGFLANPFGFQIIQAVAQYGPSLASGCERGKSRVSHMGRARNERSSFTKARCEYDHERNGTGAREPVNPLICLQGF